MKGLFITFEGGDGAGKSTLMERVFAHLKTLSLSPLKTRAPGGTKVGLALRPLLLNKGELPLAARTELFLFLADRAQLVEEVILPALAKEEIVLCDRYNDSTVAYQGVARGLQAKEVAKLCDFATSHLKPHLTLYLDLDPKEATKRMQKKGEGKDRIELEDEKFHTLIREAFLSIAKSEPERFHILDASLSPDEVFKHAMKAIDVLLFPSWK